MKNEDLSYKIRVLLDTSGNIDPEWDPDKFWNLFEARKRRLQRWVTLSYSVAAIVIFVVVSIVLTDNDINHYMNTNSKVSSIPKRENTSPSHKSQIDRSLHKHQETNAGHIVLKTSAESERSQLGHSNISSNKPQTEEVRVLIKKPQNSPIDGTYANSRYIKHSAPILAEENDNMPSLLRMYEQARQERELRNLSIQLEARVNYNSFWLTVNQHLLANRLNSDQLHYEQY